MGTLKIVLQNAEKLRHDQRERNSLFGLHKTETVGRFSHYVGTQNGYKEHLRYYIDLFGNSCAHDETRERHSTGEAFETEARLFHL